MDADRFDTLTRTLSLGAPAEQSCAVWRRRPD